MKHYTHKCKQNDAVIRFFYNENGIRELWVKITGENSWTIIGSNDLFTAISKTNDKIKRRSWIVDPDN